VSEQLRVNVATIGYRRVLTVSGEIDIASEGVLREALDAVLHSTERDIWIDLTPTTFIDGSGVKLLLGADRQLDRDHRHLTVIASRGPVLRAFAHAGVAGLLPVVPDRAAAQRLN
jgi:anti-anti-sigma factor